MSTCDNCGTEHKAGIHFCTQCGRVLPTGTKGTKINPEDVAGAFQKFAGGDLLGAAFSGKASTPDPARQAPQQSPPMQSGDPTRSGRLANRSEVLKTVARAAAIGIAKSVALSIAVLGPGFVMLLMGMTVPGMIWLFVGSFAMMAWTYRKPWRLGAIACIVPPAAAAACYVLQLWIFGATDIPLLFLGGAIAAGLAVGFWRAQTHDVKPAENGGIVAERTIGYLLVWVAAYGVTQFLGFLAVSGLAVRAGLLTGAFSTAMLATVSLVIWRQFKVLKVAPAVMTVALISGLSLITAPDTARADPETHSLIMRLAGTSETPAALSGAMPSGARVLGRKFGDIRGSDAVVGAQVELVLARPDDPGRSISSTALLILPRDISISDFIRQNMPNLPTENASCGTSSAILAVGDEGTTISIAAQAHGKALIIQTSESYHREKAQRFGEAVLRRIALATCHMFASNQSGDDGAGTQPPVVIPPKTSSNRSEPLGLDTPVCFQNISDGYVGPNPDVSPNDPSCNFTMTCRRALEIDRQGGVVDVPDTRYGGRYLGSMEIGACGTAGVLPPPGEGTSVTPEQAAAASAAIAAVLVAAGIAANVAQAIAAAITNALQAGVQLSAEEIQRAIADALRDMVGRGGSGTNDTTDTGNAPPNATSTERVRPPTPIYDENGRPFETNENGQYWGPDGDGNWRWLNKDEATEASAALHAERTQRQAEQAEHDRQTEDNLARSREKMEAENDKARDQTGSSRTDESVPVSDEERRRRALETGILNTIHGMEPGADADGLMNRLIGAHESGNRQELEQLWEQLRGERQNQLDGFEKEATRLRAESDKAQFREDIAAGARDASKILLGAGLGAATGGTASVVQAVGTAVIGSGSLITIGGIEQGHKVENGEVTFDSWEATKGAARGGLDAAGAMVGGVTANGSKVVMAGKTVFAGTSSYGRTFADTYEKTGDRELAGSRAAMAGVTEAGKTLAGEFFDEKSRQADKNAAELAKNEPAGWNSKDNGSWKDNVTAINASEKLRINGAKSAANVFGGTLTNIASSDQDLSNAQAFGQALKSEAGGLAAGKIVGAADTGGGSPKPDNDGPVAKPGGSAADDVAARTARTTAPGVDGKGAGQAAHEAAIAPAGEVVPTPRSTTGSDPEQPHVAVQTEDGPNAARSPAHTVETESPRSPAQVKTPDDAPALRGHPTTPDEGGARPPVAEADAPTQPSDSGGEGGSGKKPRDILDVPREDLDPTLRAVQDHLREHGDFPTAGAVDDDGIAKVDPADDADTTIAMEKDGDELPPGANAVDDELVFDLSAPDETEGDGPLSSPDDADDGSVLSDSDVAPGDAEEAPTAAATDGHAANQDADALLPKRRDELEAHRTTEHTNMAVQRPDEPFNCFIEVTAKAAQESGVELPNRAEIAAIGEKYRNITTDSVTGEVKKTGISAENLRPFLEEVGFKVTEAKSEIGGAGRDSSLVSQNGDLHTKLHEFFKNNPGAKLLVSIGTKSQDGGHLAEVMNVDANGNFKIREPANPYVAVVPMDKIVIGNYRPTAGISMSVNLERALVIRDPY